MRDRASSGACIFRGLCSRGGLGWRGSWSRGQDREQEQTREQERGGGHWPPAAASATVLATAAVATTASATAVVTVPAVLRVHVVCQAVHAVCWRTIAVYDCPLLYTVVLVEWITDLGVSASRE